MTSAPSSNYVEVSPAMFEFFQVELRNEESMQRDAGDDPDDDEFPPPSTLGSAHDSLTQAPDDVIRDWFWSHIHDNPQDHSVTSEMIEFGRLLERYGEDAELTDFVAES